MSFLAPLFMVGALAVALPIVFHLIRRTSRERAVFSSLMFLMPTPPRVTRRSRLENIFLLILRCLVLCLLALSFARPFFQKPVTPDPQTGAEKKIIILVDTSASMNREGLWSAARAKAEDVLKKVSPTDRVAVMTFDRQIKSLVTFEQWSSMNAGERVAVTIKNLADVKPGWAATHLGNALVAAAEAFDESESRDNKGKATGPRQIVLISDLQEGSRFDALQAYEWPRGVELVIEPLKTKRTTNAGLQLVTDNDHAAKESVDAAPRVRVFNSADSKREQFQLRWADTNSIGAAAPTDVYVPPGQSRIFSAPKLTVGAVGEKLLLTGDDDDFDNAVYLIQPKAEQVKILYLGNEATNDTAQPLYFVKNAFQQTRRQTVQVIAQRADAPLSAFEFDNTPLLILADPLPEGQLATVRQFLSNGKSALLMMKTAAAAESIRRLTDSPDVTATEAPASGYAMLGEIKFEHPLFAPFADPRFSDFTKIHFWKHRRLETDRIANARVLARFDNGDAAFLEIPVGKGKLLVLTSGWQPTDSQFALSSKFVPLLYSILEQAGGIKSAVVQYHIGDEVILPPANSTETVTVRKPDGSQVQLAKGELKFLQTDLPGLYTVTSLQPPLRFAVNLDPLESKTAPLALEEFGRLGVSLKVPELDLTKQLVVKKQLQNTELEARQKLWRWLMTAAFVVLIVETWLAGWLTRRVAVQAEAST